MKKLALALLLAGTTSMMASDGAGLFKKCASCHGANAEKAALGKSQIIKGWDAAKTEAALHGYKDGSYGGPMKGLMKGQVASLSDDDIKALSTYIAGL
jgi:cytochrome c553